MTFGHGTEKLFVMQLDFLGLVQITSAAGKCWKEHFWTISFQNFLGRGMPQNPP